MGKYEFIARVSMNTLVSILFFFCYSKDMKIIIVANGALIPTQKAICEIKDADMIIAADGGAVHLHQMGVLPQAIIGDLDSIPKDTLIFFKQKKIPVITHPSRKNQTDTELCIDYAVEQGATEIVFLGGTGHRLDHTLANIFLLRKLADRDIKSWILDAHNEIHIAMSYLKLTGKPGDLLSIIPVSDKVTGLTLEGLEYPLTDKTLYMGTALGVSNVFIGEEAIIRLESGIIIVTKSNE